MLLPHNAIGLRWYTFSLSILLLIIAFSASLSLGQYAIPYQHIWTAIWSYDPRSIDHIILTTTRMSRSVIAGSVGSALAVAGVLMQTLTRNPLASPSLFGVNAGAIFFMILFTEVFTVQSLDLFLWVAFLGAALAGLLVYCLGSLSRDGLSPIRLVLAGAAVSALFMSFTQGLLVIGQDGIDSVLFWVAGSVSGRDLEDISSILPYIFSAIVIAIFLSPQMNILLSGDEISTGLGQNTFILKVVISTLVIGLAGASVTMAGSIGFIGLIVPHMVRAVVGNDHKWLITLSALWGAILLLLADVLGRLIIPPEEVPIGVVTALVGVPIFIFLVRKEKNNE